MSVNKIVTKVDGVENKTIDFNDLKSDLAAGAHTITVEAFNGSTLINSQTKNITIAAVAEAIPHDHYYNFDEISGDLIDRKGTANGTLSGSIVRQEIGIKNQAYKFNGVNTYISVPGLNNEFTGSFSVGIWAKFSTDPTSFIRMIQNRGGGSAGSVKGWQISTDGTNYLNTMIDSGIGTAGGVGANINFEDVLFGEADSNFHFFALTFNTSTGEGKFYIDGVMKSAKTNSNLIGVDFTSTDNFEIGRSSDGNQYVDGNQDELYTYKGVWTPTEISDYVTNI